MRSVAMDGNVYVSHQGVRHVKIRDVGYEIYAYLKEDGSYGWCGGFVGPSCGWNTVEPAEQTEDDKKFRLDVEVAAVAEGGR